MLDLKKHSVFDYNRYKISIFCQHFHFFLFFNVNSKKKIQSDFLWLKFLSIRLPNPKQITFSKNQLKKIETSSEKSQSFAGYLLEFWGIAEP